MYSRISGPLDQRAGTILTSLLVSRLLNLNIHTTALGLYAYIILSQLELSIFLSLL